MTTPPAQTADVETLFDLYRTMVLIRLTEERLAENIERGEIRTPCHLYIGQEAIAAGVCAALRRDDYVWGTHRSHGHYLAKGGDLQSMISEIYGRATGCSKGRGGSMHLYAGDIGILGTVPLVAATIPLAVGAALATKLRNEDRVSVAFFGDGAMEEGHFHESLNFAALQRLPAVFVCENNFYASHLQLRERRAADNLQEAASIHGAFGARVDGNDASEIMRVAIDAVSRARRGEGPTLMECRTYRWRGHVGASWDQDVGVKRKEELKDWLPRDPITNTERRLRELGLTAEQFIEVRSEIEQRVDAAFTDAKVQPYAPVEDLLKDVFVSTREGR